MVKFPYFGEIQKGGRWMSTWTMGTELWDLRSFQEPDASKSWWTT